MISEKYIASAVPVSLVIYIMSVANSITRLLVSQTSKSGFTVISITLYCCSVAPSLLMDKHGMINKSGYTHVVMQEGEMKEICAQMMEERQEKRYYRGKEAAKRKQHGL